MIYMWSYHMHQEHMIERREERERGGGVLSAHVLMKLFACVPTLPDVLFIVSHHDKGTMANFSGLLMAK